MGCISSKKARTQSPDYDVVVSSVRNSKVSGRLVPYGPLNVGPKKKVNEVVDSGEKEGGKEKRYDLDDNSDSLRAVKRGKPQKKEHAAAGWPEWLSSAAKEAVDGWLPLRSDAYEILEKIGQGTYSTVYRARDLKSGKMVAVKKVRFDNCHRESVRFMAREITILRKLDHPNIMKLEGIITSRLSRSIFLVFQYMEHDLAGLLSCPDIKFTDSQIKCYMKQLLSGLEHCHSRGIMHRDIKSSNILVNNEGVLKIADFGLANYTRPKNKQPLTSRVVTLWYRPPELLLGSTNYEETVDLWSVGCVFAELFAGRPLLKGRTEVEQLHKIFRLCGSPQEDYWKRSRLPLARVFKPQQPYESTLWDRCKDFPKSAVSLIETFLSVEPYKRGTASSGLNSEYFNTKPYACDPSRMPRFPPNKEIDAQIRDARRKYVGSRAESGSRNVRRTHKYLQESSDFSKLAPKDQEVEAIRNYRMKGGLEPRPSVKQSYDTKSEASEMTKLSNGTSIVSAPAQVSASSGPNRSLRQEDTFSRFQSQPISGGQKPRAVYPSSILNWNDVLKSGGQEIDQQLKRTESFDSYDAYEPQELPEEYGNKKKGRVAVSGPMTYQPQEIAPRQYEQHLHAHRRSRFYID